MPMRLVQKTLNPDRFVHLGALRAHPWIHTRLTLTSQKCQEPLASQAPQALQAPEAPRATQAPQAFHATQAFRWPHGLAATRSLNPLAATRSVNPTLVSSRPGATRSLNPIPVPLSSPTEAILKPNFCVSLKPNPVLPRLRRGSPFSQSLALEASPRWKISPATAGQNILNPTRKG